jgi:hypothetical protein
MLFQVPNSDENKGKGILYLYFNSIFILYLRSTLPIFRVYGTMFRVTSDPKPEANCNEKLKTLNRQAPLRSRTQLNQQYDVVTVGN